MCFHFCSCKNNTSFRYLANGLDFEHASFYFCTRCFMTKKRAISYLHVTLEVQRGDQDVSKTITDRGVMSNRWLPESNLTSWITRSAIASYRMNIQPTQTEIDTCTSSRHFCKKKWTELRSHYRDYRFVSTSQSDSKYKHNHDCYRCQHEKHRRDPLERNAQNPKFWNIEYIWVKMWTKIIRYFIDCGASWRASLFWFCSIHAISS